MSSAVKPLRVFSSFASAIYSFISFINFKSINYSSVARLPLLGAIATECRYCLRRREVYLAKGVELCSLGVGGGFNSQLSCSKSQLAPPVAACPSVSGSARTSGPAPTISPSSPPATALHPRTATASMPRTSVSSTT